MGLRRFIRKHFGSKNSLGSAVKIIENIENDELENKRLNGTLASPAAIATPIKGVATKSGATNKLQQSAKTKSTAIIKSPAIVGVSEGKCQQKSKNKFE
ncbi:GM18168 [Drosophila sechellia]|uniref:GM18168 n=1 Tax=Drosophila sechellia TaxID=7238 RepID=B4I2V6_DROSE|nr:GM18168 [Drosophila sechellia]